MCLKKIKNKISLTCLNSVETFTKYMYLFPNLELFK